MVFSASYPHIITDDSLMETVSHGSPDYPINIPSYLQPHLQIYPAFLLRLMDHIPGLTIPD